MAENPNTNEPAPPSRGEDARDEQQPGRKAAAPIPGEPEPEEAPELLGERSDYPLSRE